MQLIRQCIWCFKKEDETTFLKKAHTIPKSLGGQNYNQMVCDHCNEFFGQTTPQLQYSIESALKETFCISRQRFLGARETKKKVGAFKSKFFDIKERKGKPRIVIKSTFSLNGDFLNKICRNFKRGLLKMWFEEYHRQHDNKYAFDEKYRLVREFARYNIGELPVIYFERSAALFIMKRTEAETPILLLNRMKYLHENDKFTEIEFLGHVFGFPVTDFTENEFNDFFQQSIQLKTKFFKAAVLIKKLTDIDFTLSILDRN